MVTPYRPRCIVFLTVVFVAAAKLRAKKQTAGDFSDDLLAYYFAISDTM